MFARNAQTIIRSVALIGLGVLSASCATRPEIRTQAALNVNLASYHTYAFMPKPGTDKEGYKTLATQSLERAVNREMLIRGYTPTGAGQPDLLINFRVKEKDKVESDVGPGVGYGMGYGWGRPYRYGYGFGFDGYYNGIQTVTEGSLMIDLIDRTRNEVVWSGTAVGQVTQKALDHPDQTLDRSVAAIFARYPISAP